ncbi:carboxypeptidase-like regulatory domain-containing protein [Chryseobacterium gotjawalense]|uniref:Carboxypeptidase-like regulatory domain-containing protein n=1 Tax=Chryseobacterium gotjawalense TaxID=3042315 RepID=A0ABY8RF51_9FLAO|nr:carboxypeptidase-like regulatory domain-containing protein [Chryseobacterium sp. wdc7]WHF52595.1 carboxypeptidase-like regulatory domain-containing protein [Chryseobacterium sp. wdc7]
MKVYILIPFVIFNFCNSQSVKLKIVDAESDLPISNARIILSNEVTYSNSDGFALLQKPIQNISISAFGYKSETISNITTEIKLTPLYQSIDEVQIKAVDFKTILENVSENYSKLYFNKSSIYDIVYKQKNIEDDSIYFLLIAEANLWTKSNLYNRKKADQKKYDDFIQLELNNIRFLKIADDKKDEMNNADISASKEFLGTLFFNYSLEKFLNFLNGKGTKYSGNLTNENNGLQNISFNATSQSGIKLFGNFTYNKVDKVITYFELNYDQSVVTPYKFKDKNNIEHEFKPGNGQNIFEFYKNEDKYIPSFSKTQSDSYITTDNIKHKKNFSREIIYQSFLPTRELGVSNKVDFTKQIWNNLVNEKPREDVILLTVKEQEFLKQDINEE